ncbi:MAG: hypothetical protein RR766_04715 [Longicatena sp.]
MSFVILGIIIAVTFIVINKYVIRGENKHELVVEELDWILSINELIQYKIVYDHLYGTSLKLSTRLDGHGHIIGIDLLTLKNHVFEYISINKPFDTKRFTPVL